MISDPSDMPACAGSDPSDIPGIDAPALGPNGHPVGFDDEGNLVEWVPCDEEMYELYDGQGFPPEMCPMILRRADDAIHAAYQEHWDKAWYVRHKDYVARIEAGEERPSAASMECVNAGKKAARKIERKYGIDELDLDDYEYGLLCGRLSALAWVLGSEWDESLDT